MDSNRNTGSTSNSDISQQAAELDDADVWIQELVTKASPGKSSTNNSNNTDEDEETSFTDNIKLMNAVGLALYEMEYNHLTCYYCCNIYHAPVTIEQCQHTFCSNCIRSKFYYTSINSTTNRQPSCPVCKCTGSSSTASSSTSTSSASRTAVDSHFITITTGTTGRSSSTTRGSSSSSLSLVPNRLLDIFIHVFRLIRQPLLKVLKKQQAKLLQHHQSKSTKEIDAKNIRFQHLPKLLESVQTATSYLQQTTTKENTKTYVNVTPTIVHQMEEDVKEYISTILDRCHNTRQVIPYPTSAVLTKAAIPGVRSTLTKSILNGKTSKKQYVELLSQQCGFTNITSMMQTSNKYCKTDSETIGVLRKMYTDYILLYNSENDTLYPRSQIEILSIIEQQQYNIFRAKSKVVTSTNSISTYVSKEQQHSAPATGAASSTAATATSAVINYDKCMEIIKRQRKLLGESPSTGGQTSKSLFWSTIKTGNVAFDIEFECNYQQLIQIYYQRFPEQKEKYDKFVQQHHKQESNYTTITKHSDRNSKIPQQENAIKKPAAKAIQENLQQRSATKEDDNYFENQSPQPTLSTSAFTTTSTPLSISHHTTGSNGTNRSSRIQQQSLLLLQSMKKVKYDDGSNDYDKCSASSYASLDEKSTKRPLAVSTNPSTTKVAKKAKYPSSDNNYDHQHNHSTTGRTSSNIKKTPPIVTIDSSSLIGPWICTHCTYYNSKDRSTRARCEMCSNIRESTGNCSAVVNKQSNVQRTTTTKKVAPPPSSQSSTGSSSIIEIDC